MLILLLIRYKAILLALYNLEIVKGRSQYLEVQVPILIGPQFESILKTARYRIQRQLQIGGRDKIA